MTHMNEGKTKKRKSNGGRPTKLTRELVNKTAQYLNVEIKNGGLYSGDLPTVAGLSIYLGVSRESIYEWQSLDNPLAKEFSDILGELNATQEYKLIGKSLRGEYNSAITKLLLTKHGYTDKVQTDLTTNGKEMPAPILGGLSKSDE